MVNDLILGKVTVGECTCTVKLQPLSEAVLYKKGVSSGVTKSVLSASITTKISLSAKRVWWNVSLNFMSCRNVGRFTFAVSLLSDTGKNAFKKNTCEIIASV